VIPPLPVLRHQISWWTNFEFSTVSSPLSGNIPPQISFVPDGPSAGKMVNLLIRVHTFESAAPDKTRPETVPATTLRNYPESGYFKRIHYTIVSVG